MSNIRSRRRPRRRSGVYPGARPQIPINKVQRIILKLPPELRSDWLYFSSRTCDRFRILGAPAGRLRAGAQAPGGSVICTICELRLSETLGWAGCWNISTGRGRNAQARVAPRTSVRVLAHWCASTRGAAQRKTRFRARLGMEHLIVHSLVSRSRRSKSVTLSRIPIGSSESPRVGRPFL